MFIVTNRGSEPQGKLGMAQTNDLYSTTLADIASMDTLYGHARPLIQAKARKLVGTNGFTVSDREDIEQEAYVQLIARFEKARQLGKLPVIFFIDRVLDQSIKNQIRYRKSGRRDYRRTTSIHRKIVPWAEAELSAYIPDTSDIGSSLVWLQDLLDFESVIDSLDEDERKLCLRLGIFSVAELARKTNLPRSTIQGRVRKLQPKFLKHDVHSYK